MVNKQKMRELALLKEAKYLEPTLFPGIIIDSEGEKPDILMQSTDRIIGIEITDYWRGRSQQKGGSAMHRSEKAQWNLANMAYQSYTSNHSEPVFVTFYFKSQEVLDGKQLIQLASALADIVGQHIPQELYAKRILDYSELEGTELEPFVYGINVQRMRDDYSDGWGVVSSGFISASSEELQGIINEKDPKLDVYLTRCDEVSLLIVAESFLDLSGHISFSQDVLSHKYIYNFNRVLFYDRATEKVHLLKK
jgi:hypothetical protein